MPSPAGYRVFWCALFNSGRIINEAFVNGKLTQKTLAFLVQDDESNVWDLGEHREMYDEKRLIGGRSLIVGHTKDVQAEIIMRANPGEGTPNYSEGFARAPYKSAGRGRIRKMGERITVPAGSYDDVLVIEHSSDHEPSVLEIDYYAPGVGKIRVGWGGKDPEKEKIELVKILQLEPQDMDQISAQVLQIEERAYVYSSTQPAQRRTQ